MKLNLEKTLNSRLVLLSVGEERLRRSALGKILEAAEVQTEDFNTTSLIANEKPITEWFNIASTLPFLSKRRVVVVRHLLRFGEPPAKKSGKAKKEVQPVYSIPPTGLLILVADEEQGDESKQKRYASLLKGWESWVSGQNGVVLSFKVSPKDIRDELKQEAEKNQKRFSSRALEVLIEMTGSSLSEALSELEKVLLYCGDKEEIKEQDVRNVVIASSEWNVFKIVDAMTNGQISVALSQLNVLLGSQSRPEEAAHSRILPMLSRQLKLLWQGRLFLEAKIPLSQKDHPVTQMLPSKPNLLAEPEWSQNRVMHAAKRTNLESLSQCFNILTQVDARLKGILPGTSPKETLEQMILQMCSTMTY